MPVDNLEGFTVGVTYFGDMDDLINPTVVSPDAGGVYRYVLFCVFGCTFVIADGEFSRPNRCDEVAEYYRFLSSDFRLCLTFSSSLILLFLVTYLLI